MDEFEQESTALARGEATFEGPGPRNQASQKAKAIKYIQLSYPKVEVLNGPCERLVPNVDIKNFSELCSKHPGATSVYQFLQEMPFKRTQDPAQGTTWLELYIVYRMLGHPEPVSRDQNLAVAKPTMGAQLREFRAVVRKVVRWAFAGKSMLLFRGTESKGHALRTLGLRTILATMPYQLQLTEGARRAVAQHIVRAQANRSGRQASALLDEGSKVKLQPLRTKGKAQWSRGIPKWGAAQVFQQPMPGSMDSSAASGVDCHRSRGAASASSDQRTCEGPDVTASTRPLPQTIFVFCPKCQFAVDGTRPAFRIDKLDQKTWCKRCHRSHAISNWACACHTPWHACPRHQGEPARLRQTQRQPVDKKSHAAPKRALQDISTEAEIKRLDQPRRTQPSEDPDEIDLGERRQGDLIPKLRHKYRRILREESTDARDRGQVQQADVDEAPASSTAASTGQSSKGSGRSRTTPRAEEPPRSQQQPQQPQQPQSPQQRRSSRQPSPPLQQSRSPRQPSPPQQTPDLDSDTEPPQVPYEFL